MKNPKFQVPSSKEVSSSKIQKLMDERSLDFEIWNFLGAWNLELGT
jgi:hypothetical protein